MSLVGTLLLVGLSTLAAALPWGLPADACLVLPLLPYAVLHVATVTRDGAVPEWLAFVAGLALDLLTGGPLGYWALVYLAGYGATVLALPWARRGRGPALAVYGATLAWLAGVEAALSTLALGAAPDARSLIEAAGWAVVAYAALAVLVGGRGAAAGGKDVPPSWRGG